MGFCALQEGHSIIEIPPFHHQFGHSIEPRFDRSLIPEEYIGFFFSREPVRLVDIIVEMVNTKVLQFLDGFWRRRNGWRFHLPRRVSTRAVEVGINARYFSRR